MKYLKIFEEFTQQTANLQKVKITSSDSHGEIIMIGHILHINKSVSSFWSRRHNQHSFNMRK